LDTNFEVAMFKRLIVPFVLITAVFAALAAVGHKYFSYFLFIFLYLFFTTILLSARLQTLRTLLYNLAFVFLALFLFEGNLNYKSYATGATQWGSYTSGYFTSDPVKGYGAPHNAAQYTSMKKQKTGELIYDITYTMDKNGLRITSDGSAHADHPVWFFGCSFTIGEGVRDEDTLPYLYAAKSGVKTYNFGFHGYGPHQMLRMLETTYITDIDPKKPSLVYYNAISVHIERAAGLVAWDKDGPNYVLDGDTVRYAGKFSDGNLVIKYMDKIAAKSLVYGQVIRPLLFKLEDSDRDRYIRIVKKSADVVREKYGSKLVVVLWDVFADRSAASDIDSDFIEKELTARNVEVVRVSKALGRDNYKQYFIPHDGHPTVAGHTKVAELLIRR
jgi:hypothetical protein